jgi:hypothetical protein
MQVDIKAEIETIEEQDIDLFNEDDEMDEETSENENDYEQEEITEIWKKIEDYENYEINNFGLVKNIKTNKIL